MNNERLLQMMAAAEAEAYGHLRGLVDDVVEEPDMAAWLLHQLDERLHPWGEVGELPAEVGEYWAVGGSEPWAVVVQKTPRGLRVNTDPDSEITRYLRFRKRCPVRTP